MFRSWKLEIRNWKFCKPEIFGTSKISNFIHIVLNNGVHESVGGQPSVGFDINFTKIARNAGYNTLDHEIFNEK